jgi:hypothetical protein
MGDSEKAFSSQANFHLAGIIPVAGQPLEYGMPYPDCLLPVAPDYTMIEAAVVEAAFAGCDTIWIICNDDLAPVVRYRVGDFIQDPIHFYNKFEAFPKDRRKRIPIYWVPVHAKDRYKRDCLSWSVLTGAISCLKIASQLSNWLIPDKYYVSFPYGIIDPRKLRSVRRKIRNKNNFYITSDGKSSKDNLYTSFTFGKEEFILYRRNVRKGTGKYTSEVKDERGLPRSKIPLEERWSARFFEPKDVFVGDDRSQWYEHKADEFYNLNDWDAYREYMLSDLARDTQRPTKELFAYREFNRIAKDRD